MGPFLLYDFLYLAHLFTTLRGKSPVSGCILNNCLDTKKGTWRQRSSFRKRCSYSIQKLSVSTDQCHALDGYSITELLLLREGDAPCKNLSATIIFSNTPSSTRAIKSEGYYQQLQNLLHRAAPAMSYNGTYYTNVESLDREKSKVRCEKWRIYLATSKFWFRDTEHFFSVELC